ncbi:uncharacterized protein LOC144134780 isoform X1 [Amblyomma americanum]
MDFFKLFNFLVISAAAVASMTSIRCAHAQDCMESPADCDATQVLSDFPLFDAQATSDLKPKKYCGRYERMSLSDDGNTAQYKVVYVDASANNTPTHDTSTLKVASNTGIYVTYGSDTGTVYQLTLDYVNGDQCLIGHCNCTVTQYYMLAKPDSDALEYKKCFNKIDGYSGGNLTMLRGLQKCRNISPKP